MRLYFDANTIIQIVEAQAFVADDFRDAAVSASGVGTTILTSELTLAEVLVKPLREQDFKLIVAYNNLLAGGAASQIRTIPITREILGLAARVRNKRMSVKLPDAIHIATAEFSGCDAVVTADKRWGGATEIKLTDPNEIDLAAFIKMAP
ncbi:type II toxin-antitoxin system VapC family toxin [Xanthobacter autotrophicus]|uniref:type II toxin-antitoxin system VapC family toxin n=1 Tax=Xanthobacter autotrophicus TaxID=280 RepID=UPI0037270B46